MRESIDAIISTLLFKIGNVLPILDGSNGHKEVESFLYNGGFELSQEPPST